MFHWYIGHAIQKMQKIFILNHDLVVLCTHFNTFFQKGGSTMLPRGGAQMLLYAPEAGSLISKLLA